MLCAQTTPSDRVRTAIDEVLCLALAKSPDLRSFERTLHAALMDLGGAVLVEQLQALDRPHAFDEGGVRWKPTGAPSPCRVITTFGPVDVPRRLFRSERNGPTRCLVSEGARLVDSWTEPAMKIALTAASELPLVTAAALLADLNVVRVSKSSLLRVMRRFHDQWEPDRANHEAAIREAAEIPTDAYSVAVSLDGVMVLTTDSDRKGAKKAARAEGRADKGPAGYKEASVAAISFYDRSGERLATRRYGRMPETHKSTTKQWIADELASIRRARPDLVTVAIADGAPDNWSFLHRLGCDVELVDFFHTMEHLHRHVHQANGASTLASQAIVRKYKRTLLTRHDGGRRVGASIQRLRESAGTAAVSTLKVAGKRQPTFFERHHARMDYKAARDANLPIGSGVTEATCKSLVCDRMRRSGMRWGAPGGQAVLTIRALRSSRLFDEAWGRFIAIAA